MARLETLQELATEFPQCLGVHKEIKYLMPQLHAMRLLDMGFQDVSWGNDECPSYSIEQEPMTDHLSIFVMQDRVDGKLLSRDILYTIVGMYGFEYEPTTNIENVIEDYMMLVTEQEEGLKHE